MERLKTWTVAALLVASAAVSPAGHATLKNGMSFEGELVPIPGFTQRQLNQKAGEIDTNPFVMVDAGYKRYFLPLRQIVERDAGKRLVSFDVFELPKKKSPSNLQIGSVGLPVHVSPFSEHGVRQVTLNTSRGHVPIVQGVTRISPDYLTVEGINGQWWQGISTDAVPPEELAAMLHTAIDELDPDDRMSVARFYLQARQYDAAARELEGIARDFPELADKVSEFDRELRQVRAQWLLSELRRRQAAGQHRIAYALAEAFPDDLGFDAEILRQVEALRIEYRAAREKADHALLLLGELEAGLEDSQQRARLAELRPVLREQLDWDSLPRLDAFLTLAGDESLPVGDRLALAYSGWVVGSANATTDLPKAIALWRARHLVGEYLRSADPGRRSELLLELTSLESVGTDEIQNLIPLLPPWIETPDLGTSPVKVVETLELVPGWGAETSEGKAVLTTLAGRVPYAIALPPGYRPTRNYPVIVALRPSEWSIEQTAAFWGIGRDGAGRPSAGPATSEGYIVIAPEYAAPPQVTYGYTAREHLGILAAITDAKRRLAIDSDRVFLAGHGMGGDATFDIALSHPDLFAGAVPISGLCDQHVKYYKGNSELVPFYIVNGELDRNARERNADDLAYMMKRGHDIIWCEFVGRGYEYYREELSNVFAWAARLKRAPDPKEIEAKVLRACDDRFYWVKAEGIPQTVLNADVANPRGRTVPRPMVLEARINQANAITLRSAASRYLLRLNSQLVDLEQRVKIQSGGRQVFNDFVAPETGALLDDLLANGDRQRLYPIRIVVD